MKPITTSTGLISTETTATVDFYFVMKDGENIISLYAAGGYTLIFFDIDFERVGSAEDAILDKGATKEELYSYNETHEDRASYPLQWMDRYGYTQIEWMYGNLLTATYQVEDVPAGTYMLLINYQVDQTNRTFALWVDGGDESIDLPCYHSGRSDTTSRKASAVYFITLSEGTHTFEIGGANGNITGNLAGITLIPIGE